MRYKYQSTLKDGNGKVIDAATISIYLAGTTTAADVYAASSGGTAVNYATTSDGAFSFWIDTGDYDSDQTFKIVSSKDGFVSTTWDNIAIFPPYKMTAAATASTLMLRDANGRAKVSDPSADGDIVNKGYLGTAATIDVGLAASNLLQADQAEASTATATTTALGTATTKHLLTGTTTITGFAGTAGVTYHCRAEGIFILTHHGTNLIITQAGASITTAAGDTFDVQMITGTTCRVVNFERASGVSTKEIGTASGTVVLAENIRGGFKNQIINGGFFVNQREYVSTTATSIANQYTLDRWRVVTSGENLTFADSGGKRTVTAPAGGIEQVIEGAFLQTGTYTISWEGTATCTVNATARTTGESFSITGGVDVTVKFSGGTVANAQLEAGPVATPFEKRSFEPELALCQRYYLSSPAGFAYSYRSGNVAVSDYRPGALLFPTEMRTTPTISIVAAVTSNITGALRAVAQINSLAPEWTETTATTNTSVAADFNADAEL